MANVSERISQSAFDGSRLRVILMMDLYDGAQNEFLEAYEHMRNQVASIPGHISDQLCQSIENPSQWLITSEWESAPPFLAWVNSEEHVATVQPLHNCVRDTRSLRFSVLRETGAAFESTSERAKGGLQAAPRLGDGVVRHALTFTVKPGTEEMVAKILADYDSPQARVDENTRLRRTSLFMHGNRVVRAVEVEGDLMAALRHVSRQPEVRAVEEAINPYLEQDRDLSDPDSARMFFTRAALPTVHHVKAGRHAPEDVERHSLFYQAKEGCGMALARLLMRPGRGGGRRRLESHREQHDLPARRRRGAAPRSERPARRGADAGPRHRRTPQGGHAGPSCSTAARTACRRPTRRPRASSRRPR